MYEIRVVGTSAHLFRSHTVFSARLKAAVPVSLQVNISMGWRIEHLGERVGRSTRQVGKKVRLFLQQSMKAQRVVRRRDSHIF
jgi:hypothetical protein